MAGMGRGLGQTAEGSHQFFAAQLTGLIDGSSLHQFSEQRGAGHGGNAALGEKSYFFDAAAVTRRVSFRISPQAGFSIWAEASGFATSPGLRGFWK